MWGKLIGKSAINCTTKSIDCYGIKVAQCEINGRDLGALMVLSGNAIDYKYFSKGYYSREQQYAKEQKAGLWRGKFMQPRTWRKRN